MLISPIKIIKLINYEHLYQAHYTEKVIHVSERKKGFFYVRNRHGALGKFKPTEDEFMYIMEQLIAK